MKKRTWIFFFAVFIMTVLRGFAIDYYVDVTRPDDSGDGLSWASAKRTIQAAVVLANAGDTVTVADGIYAEGGEAEAGFMLTNRVYVTRPVTVRSANGSGSTTIRGGGVQGEGAVRGVFLSSGAVLEGFTIEGGGTLETGDTFHEQAGGGAWVATNCVLRECHVKDCTSGYGGGAGIYVFRGGKVDKCVVEMNESQGGMGGGIRMDESGAVIDSDIRLNRADMGAGIAVSGAGADVTRCKIYWNEAGYEGGGIRFDAGGTAQNCLIKDNTATNYGGGVSFNYGGVLYNCTVVENSAGTTGGGVAYYDAGQTINSIVWGNTAGASVDDVNVMMPGGEISNLYVCAGSGVTSGTDGCIVDDPQFADKDNDDYRLRSTSPCFNAGWTGFPLQSNDLAGDTRLMFSLVDMGAYERQYQLSASSGPAQGGNTINISAGTIGSGTDISSVTVCGVSATILNQGMNWLEIELGSAGDLTADLLGDVVILSDSIGETRYANAYTYLFSTGTVYYVDASRPDDAGDGLSWATAKQVIQSAVDIAPDGAMIMVREGYYDKGGRVATGMSLMNRVCLDKPVQLVAFSRGDSVQIAGGGSLGTDAVRGVYVGPGASLRGFRITYGMTREAGATYDEDKRGGGVYVAPGGVVEDCVIESCDASMEGGGAYLAGRMLRCRLRSNGNDAVRGGAVCLAANGELINSTITENTGIGALSFKAGAGALAANLLVAKNYGGMLQPAGVLIEGAVSGDQNYLLNCTLTDNYGDATATEGTGPLYGVYQNCIIYSNGSPALGDSIYSNCCLPTLSGVAGANNSTNDPEFVNFVSGNFHLASSSWCVNAGNTEALTNLWPDTGTAADLDDAPRVQGGQVDLGAMEYPQGPNRALHFNGVDQYAEISTQISGLSTMTIEAWICLDRIKAAAEWSHICTKSYDSLFAVHENRLAFSVGDGTAWGTILESVRVLETGQWYHVAAIWDSGTGDAQLFINGQSEPMLTVGNYMGFSSYGQYIGAADNGGTGMEKTFFPGRIDELRIWDYPRSIAELQHDMFLTLDGGETGLKTYYRFDAAGGAHAVDYSLYGTGADLRNANEGAALPAWTNSGAVLANSPMHRQVNTAAAWPAESTTVGSGSTAGLSLSTALTDETNRVVIGDDGGVGTTMQDIPVDVTNRLGRIWYADVAGGVTADCLFTLGDAQWGGGADIPVAEYLLLERAATSGVFSVAVTGASNIIGDAVTFSDVDIAHGYYTLGWRNRSAFKLLSNTQVPIASSNTPAAADGTAFPYRHAGADMVHTFIITNAGAADLDITGLETNGTNPDSFAVAGLPAIIPAQSAQAFTITFKPAGYGYHSAQVVFSNNSLMPAFHLNLSGRAFDLSVSNGPSSGGNPVTIFGDSLGDGTDITDVFLCGIPASITSQTYDQVMVSVGEGPQAGVTGDVMVVSTTGGTTVFTNAYTYNPAGMITTVDPSSGPTVGGFSVRISGTELCDGTPGDLTGISINNTVAQSIDEVFGSTQIVVTASSTGMAGTGNVEIHSTSRGITIASNAFTYLDPATIQCSPNTLSFTGTFGSANPAAQSLALDNTGQMPLTFSNSVAYGAGASGWFTLLPATGNLAASAGTVLTGRVDQAGLHPGVYFATNRIFSAEAQNSPYELVVSFSIGKGEQTISFDPVGPQLTTNEVTLTAAASSGLPVGFSVVSGPGLLTGGQLSFTGAGSVVLQADQTGNTDWNAAPGVRQTVDVSRASATVTLNNLTQTYDGAPREISATTVPAGLAVDLTYNGSPTAPVNAGAYAVTGTVNDAFYGGSATGLLVVARASQTITFDPISDSLTTDQIGLDASADSALPVSFAVAAGPATLSGGTNLSFSGAGTVSIAASQPGDANWQAAPPVTNTFAVTKAFTALTFSNLVQTYDGTQKAIAVTADPPVTTLDVTYNGLPSPPINAGDYAVTAIVSDAIYQGEDTAWLQILKAEQTISFPPVGTQIATSTVTLAASADSGLTVAFSLIESGPGVLIGDQLSFTATGQVVVAAEQDGSANYEPASTVVQTIQVVNASATVTLADLNQTYDYGAPREISATTVPAGLAVEFTYDGGSQAPTNAGSYSVRGIIVDDTYAGSTTGLLVVAQAAQTITFDTIGDQLTTDEVGLTASADSALPVVFNVAAGPAILSGGTNLTFTGAGTVSIAASQPGDVNWQAALPVTNTFAVTKAFTTLNFTNLMQTYDGTQKAIAVTADPPVTTIDVTYNGLSAPPVNAGDYAVTAIVSDAIYQGEDTAWLQILKASQTIDFPPVGTQIATSTVTLAASVDSGLTVAFSLIESGPGLLAGDQLSFTATGQVIVAAEQGGSANYEPAPTAVQTIQVVNASATVTLVDLNQTYDYGAPREISATTVPAGLAVEFTYDGGSLPPTNAGSYSVRGIIVDDTYAGSATGLLMVAQAAQTVTFDPIGDQLTTDEVGLTASADSALPVVFNVAAGPAILSGGTNLTFTGAGTVSIAASQPGAANWQAAPPVTNTFAVTKAFTALTFTNLMQTYDGTQKAVTVTADPPVTTIDVTYNGLSAPPVNAGDYAVTAIVSDAIYQGKDTAWLQVLKAEQTIDFPPVGTQIATSIVTLAASADSGLTVAFSLIESGPGVLIGDQLSFTATGQVVVAAEQGGSANYEPASTVVQTIQVVNAAATVTLADLNQTYDYGAPREISATTDPAGLAVEFTYDGGSLPPTNAGSYSVRGIIVDDTYAGSSTGLLVVAQAAQTVTFDPIGDQLTTDEVGLTASADSALPVVFNVAAGPAILSGGTNLTFTGAGTVSIAASQPGDVNWQAAMPVTNTFAVTKAFTTLNFTNLAQTYDGTQKAIAVTADPPVTTIDVTYNGLPTPPVNAGDYAVTAIVSDAIYQGEDTAWLQILKADQTISFPQVDPQLTTNEVMLNASASSGLPVGLSVVSGPGTLTGNQLNFTGAGSVVLRAAQAGNTNWNAAPDVLQTVAVSRVVASVMLDNLTQTYDGTPCAISATTDPSGLAVEITYDTSTIPPINAGTYAVTGTVNDALYSGSASGSLLVQQADQVISNVAPPSGGYAVGETIHLSAEGGSSGNPVQFTNTAGSVLWLSETTLQFTVVGTVDIEASQAGDINYSPASDVFVSYSVFAASSVYYVAPDGSDANSGLEWAQAKQTIQGAVLSASDDSLIRVSNGVYSVNGAATPGATLNNRVMIDRRIRVESVNGSDVTIIEGGSGTRCAYLDSNAVMQGFTLRGGQALTGTESLLDLSGGGAYLTGDAELLDCRLVDNAANNAGGGAFINTSGRVAHCLVISNAAENGGGVCLQGGGVLEASALITNTAILGGGAYFDPFASVSGCSFSANYASAEGGAIRSFNGTVFGCNISSNSSPVGGGIFGGEVVDSYLIGNRASTGGGANDARLLRCILTGNQAQYGGGASACELINSLLYGNSATVAGGGADQGSLLNSTVANNNAPQGSGIYRADATNSIIYANLTGPNHENSALMYSCSTPPYTGGTGNISDAPAFVDPSADNYRLTAASPCINAGDPLYTTNSPDMSWDLEHANRVQLGRLDMGCFEFYGAPAAPVAQPPSAISTERFVAHWTPFGGVPVTNYLLEVTNLGGVVTGYTPFSAGTATTAVVTGLVDGTDYQYHVRAQGEAGASDWSAWQALTTLTNAALHLDPATLAYNANYRGTPPAGQALVVSNSGQVACTFTAYTASAWIHLSTNQGTLAAAETRTLNITVDHATLNAGTYTGSITVDSSDAGNVPLTCAITLTVARAAQTIRFDPIPDQAQTNTYMLTASAQSGLPVSFAVASGPAVISEGRLLQFTSTGVVSIVANQAGNGNWLAAPPVTNTFTVYPVNPVVIDYTWTGAQNDSWANTNNWRDGHIPNSQHTAILYAPGTRNIFIALNGTQQVGGIHVNTNVSSALIKSGGALWMTNTGCSVNMTGGRLTIYPPLVMGAGATLSNAPGTLFYPAHGITVNGTLAKDGPGLFMPGLTNRFGGDLRLNAGTITPRGSLQFDAAYRLRTAPGSEFGSALSAPVGTAPLRIINQTPGTTVAQISGTLVVRGSSTRYDSFDFGRNTLELQSGSTLRIENYDDGLNSTSDYTIATFRALTGTFDTITGLSNHVVRYNANTIVLEPISRSIPSSEAVPVSKTWKLEYFPLDYPGDDADTDNDGFSNRDEFIAGTSPLEPQSCFCINQLESSSTGSCLFIIDPSTTGRLYGIQWSPDLAAQNWMPVGLYRKGTGGRLELTATTTPSGGFYRLTVELE